MCCRLFCVRRTTHRPDTAGPAGAGAAGLCGGRGSGQEVRRVAGDGQGGGEPGRRDGSHDGARVAPGGPCQRRHGGAVLRGGRGRQVAHRGARVDRQAAAAAGEEPVRPDDRPRQGQGCRLVAGGRVGLLRRGQEPGAAVARAVGGRRRGGPRVPRGATLIPPPRPCPRSPP